MFSGKTTDDLLWALALFFLTKELGRRRNQGQGGPRPIPGPQGTMLEAGYYWIFLNDWQERQRYFDWLKRRRAFVTHRKTFGKPAIDQSIMLFQVLPDRGSVKWDAAGIPGIPTPAPKGMATAIGDLEGLGASSVDPDTWSEFIGSLVQAGPQVLRDFDSYMQETINRILKGED